ncbi:MULTISPECIES: NAD(P)H-dependent flavin oxidoreductase [Desulfosediminicola]|uniref:NAD(P)H-dependent flavin oxidoreductase n=1 Tax=Desulfosediminicola TaxID=2886823 RepID=UPI0010AD82BC|nr:nitronate monooxygenase family protein [Desulfosediminicola ganghwensis]
MKLPSLTIGKFTVPFPLLQGGMSIRVSTSSLAAPVANCGGIGIIGGSAIPAEELQEDIRKAKAMTDGVVGVNIMYAMKNFYNNVMGSIESGIDMIVTGAGFSRDIFKIGKEHNVPIVMIVSSPSLAKLAEKLGASAIIAEAAEAGGHLGTDKPLREIFPSIRDAVKNIPLIAAGGISNGYEMAEMMDKYGADGVQIASRFVLSEECDVSDKFKQAYLDAGKEDIVLTSSPVGLPGRAINTPFVSGKNSGEDHSTKRCVHKCLKKCDHHYCISERLIASRDGNIDEGLVFAGSNTYKMKNILPVSEIFNQFKEQAEAVYKEGIGFAPAAS